MHKPMATCELAMGGPTKELCNGQNRPSTDTSLYDQAGMVVAGLVHTPYQENPDRLIYFHTLGGAHYDQ